MYTYLNEARASGKLDFDREPDGGGKDGTEVSPQERIGKNMADVSVTVLASAR